jgi:hypothetical protein
MVKIQKKYPNAILEECVKGKKLYSYKGKLIECDIEDNILSEIEESSKLEKKLLKDFDDLLKNLKEE